MEKDYLELLEDPMSACEFKFIKNQYGLTYREIGENACKILGRKKPYSKDTIIYWVNAYGDYKKLNIKQVTLLKYSMPEEIFYELRKRYKIEIFGQFKDGIYDQHQYDRLTFKEEKQSHKALEKKLKAIQNESGNELNEQINE